MHSYRKEEPKVKVAAKTANVSLVPLILVSVVILLVWSTLSGI